MSKLDEIGLNADQKIAVMECIVARDRQIEDLKEEISGDTDLILSQGVLLNGVVNAIRGDPLPLHGHSHHDAVELVKGVVSERDKALAEVMGYQRRESDLYTLLEGAIKIFKGASPALPPSVSKWCESTIAFMGKHGDGKASDHLDLGEKLYRELLTLRAKATT